MQEQDGRDIVSGLPRTTLRAAGQHRTGRGGRVMGHDHRPTSRSSRARGASLLLLAALAAASLYLLVLAPRPISAQSPGEAASVSVSGDDLWAATLRVANYRGMFGYSTSLGRTIGDLSADSFSWRGANYRVDNLLFNRRPRDSEAWNLLIDISPALPENVGSLSLRLGDQWLNLTNARGNRRQYFWHGVDLQWRSGVMVQVGLREFPGGVEPRSIDGYGNNRRNPELGSANTPFLRLAGVSFEYAMSAQFPERPDPRVISNILLAQSEPMPSAVLVTDMFWQWGQFLDHDMTLTLENFSDRAPIAVPRGDPVFDPFGRGGRTIDFNRSQFQPGTGIGPDIPRAQVNELTSFLDASNVYGSSLLRSRALRTNDGTGRLKTSGDGRFMPYNVDRLFNENGNVPRSRHDELFLAGDIRANDQVGLISIQTLFLREHNRLAGLIAEARPDLTGQEIFELARKIVGAQVQAITFHEFLPLLLGPGAIGPYRGYDSDVDASIAMEFSTAGFRIGHTLLSPMLLQVGPDGEQRAMSLADVYFTPSVVTDYGISGLLRGLSSQVAQQVDAKVVNEIRNLLFGAPGGPGRDLAALNIQRGRDHGVPSYNDVRGAYRLPPARAFADITSDPAVQDELRRAYGDVELVELWPGGLAEDHVPGTNVGETFRTIIADQFRRLRDGDRFWYEQDPYFLANPDLLEEVRRTTLAQIIRRNTEIGEELPDVVFGGLRPTVAISAAVSQVEEGADVSFSLTRTGPISRELSVGLNIVESGAVLGAETGTSAHATFGVGEHTVAFVLATDNDAAVEFDGAVEASIIAGTEYESVANSSAASVSVLDNDHEEINLDAGPNWIVWPGLDGIAVGDALRGTGGQVDVSRRVYSVLERDDANNSWRAYFPALGDESRINSLRTLRSGGRYWIGASEPFAWRVPKAQAD